MLYNEYIKKPGTCQASLLTQRIFYASVALSQYQSSIEQGGIVKKGMSLSSLVEDCGFTPKCLGLIRQMGVVYVGELVRVTFEKEDPRYESLVLEILALLGKLEYSREEGKAWVPPYWGDSRLYEQFQAHVSIAFSEGAAKVFAKKGLVIAADVIGSQWSSKSLRFVQRRLNKETGLRAGMIPPQGIQCNDGAARRFDDYEEGRRNDMLEQLRQYPALWADVPESIAGFVMRAGDLMGTRLRNCLSGSLQDRYKNITFIDMLQLSPEMLLSIKGMGRGTVNELAELLGGIHPQLKIGMTRDEIAAVERELQTRRP